MMQRFIKLLAGGLGYEVRSKKRLVPQSEKHFLGYDLEQEAYDNILTVRSYTMVPYARLVTLYQQVVFCETHGIPGSFVECGTWKGGATGLMALGNLEHGRTRRHIHLFDSFEGIPEPDESIDGEKAMQQVRDVGGGTKGRLVSVTGFYEKHADGVGNVETNKYLLETIIGYEPSFLHYHKGWFQNTVLKAAPEIGEIAILRLDADWYASTKVCLEYLYDTVVSGGFVIVDDYGYYEGCKKAVDEFMKQKKIHAYLNHIDSEGRYWIKP